MNQHYVSVIALVSVMMLLCSYSESMLELIRSMLSVDAASRPDVSQVISRLRQLLSAEESASNSLDNRA